MKSEDNSSEFFLEGLLLFDQDDAKARPLIVKAAEMDNPDALYFAYLMLSQGLGGPFDRAKAFQFLQRAVEHGHIEAIYSLGYCYLAGGMGNVGYSDEILAQQPVAKDIPRALELLNTAVASGHGLAALRLAEYWENESEKSPELLQQAIDWYERGMVLGEPNCLIHLADFLILGKGLPKNPKQAKRLYKKAAKSDEICAKKAAQQRLEDFDNLESILGL